MRMGGEKSSGVVVTIRGDKGVNDKMFS